LLVRASTDTEEQAMNAFQVDDMVTLNPDYDTTGQYRETRFQVTKLPVGVRGVNYQVKNLTTGKLMRGPEAAFLPLGTEPAAPVIEAPLPSLVMGELVTVSGAGWKKSTTELYVVLGLRNDGKVKIVKLGGDANRYYPSMPRKALTQVPVPAVLVVL
jgi:hypothetical protein